MSADAPKPDKARKKPAKRSRIYRGIRLRKTLGPTRFTREELERAVDEAFEKRAARKRLDP